MDRDYGVKIKDIMLLRPFQRARIIAGGDNSLERVVRSINVLEVPDIADWKIKNELLLSQGFSLKHEKDRGKILKIIVEKGAAGLCLKPKRYLEKVPDDMVELANKLEFPLIELPFELTFSEIIASVMNMINSKQTMILEQSAKTHKELMNIVLKGGDIEHICSKISDSINNTVVIEDKYGKPLAYSIKVNSGNEKEVVEHFLAKKYFQNSQKIDAAFSNNIGINKDYKEVKIPIITELKFFGYICVLETVRPLMSFDIIAVENATTVIALAIMKKKAIEEIEKRHLNEFIDLVISKNVENDQEIIQQGEYYGIDLEKKHNIILIHCNDNDSHEKESISVLEKNENAQRVRNKLYDIIKFTLSMEGYKGIVGTKAGDIVVLFESDEYEDYNLLKKELDKLAHKILLKAQKELKNDNIIASISRRYKGIYISEGYKEAKKALLITQNNNLSKGSRVVHFEELGIFRLLHYVPKKDLDDFLKEYLQPLIQYDEKNDCHLIKTLEAYFMFNGNIKDTAKYLYVHYNTIVYRLQKIKEIVGHNFEEWNERLNMQLALKLMKLQNEQ